MILVQGVKWGIGKCVFMRPLSMVNKASVPEVAITASCTFKVGQP
jgi:hypothetical protein